MTTSPAELPPASQKLLLELARRDTGDGVAVRYSGRDRWYLDSVSTQGLYSTRLFPALCKAGLTTGWDEYGESPLHITEAGRKLAAELEQQAKAQRAAKQSRPKANPDGPTAMRLLREIAKQQEPVPVYDDGRRRVWQLGSRDGFSASVDIWLALAKADRIRIDRTSSIGGHLVTVTDAGRARLASA
ncbi:hypothetical protein KYY02_19220 [Streptomyces pimonensis]|uniref:Uncharacterized protein n=1 Tax=Streptomyces pimonensis TaxID=2860288 RepID=A0ABV4J1D8_9ACTN